MKPEVKYELDQGKCCGGKKKKKILNAFLKERQVDTTQIAVDSSIVILHHSWSYNLNWQVWSPSCGS